MQGDVQRSKLKLRQAEERGVSHVISGMDDLTIGTSIFNTQSLDRMEEVRGAGAPAGPGRFRTAVSAVPPCAERRALPSVPLSRSLEPDTTFLSGQKVLVRETFGH